MSKKISIESRFIGVELSDWLFIVPGLSVFSAIVLHTIKKSSLWLDEGFSAYIIKFNFFDIAKYTALDVHPPLYYWTLKIWCMFFGRSELALRSLSLFFGCIAILFGYFFVKRLFNKRAAYVSLILLILSPMLVRYSQEARMYTMSVAIGVAATYILALAYKSKKRKLWILYGVLVGAGMLTHYFTALIWLTHWIWRADVIRQVTKKKDFFVNYFSDAWIMSNAVAFGIFFVWLPFFLAQFFVVQTEGFWHSPVSLDSIRNFFVYALVFDQASNIVGWGSFGLLSMSLILVLFAVRIYKTMGPKRNEYGLIVYMTLLPAIILFVLSLPPLRSVFIDRYLLVSAVCLSLFIAVTVSISFRSIWQINSLFVIIIAIVSMSFGVMNVWRLGNYNKEGNYANLMRQSVQKVSKNKENTGQPIIVGKPGLFYTAEYYSFANNPIYFIDDPNYHCYGFYNMLNDNNEYKITDIKEFGKEHPIIWYIDAIYDHDEEYEIPYPGWEQVDKTVFHSVLSPDYKYYIIKYQVGE